MDGVVRENEGWCVGGCGVGVALVPCAVMGLFKRWGRGSHKTILSPAVGKSKETKREREREEGGGPDMCFNVDILV